ncbi:hypothetical protein [Stenotrophomonas sp. 24(2023)]|uniref:alpha/beta hydrolase family protein n=1 Tax=Stenotrophomonas sp. 24(2023) TaxID=3068324 RepID=UPI0027DEFB6A|nr:hypothetical protein [Stenotrophomonas sp. 24(2023)]WMJ71410.1 hypothetical protein Q9R17_03740 [Stenotrophomonas sp. 24(2023)]
MRPLALALLLSLPGAPLAARTPAPPAPRVQTGDLQGAPWRIDMPAHWNGELVMIAHGFEPSGVPRQTPWPADQATPALLAAGYAVAQSGYARQGWAVADGIADTDRLRAHFIATHPRTHKTWIIGYSMGGAIAIGSLERLPRHYDGGVALCGANLPGLTIAGEVLTTTVAFDYFFPDTPGLPPEGLASPHAAPVPQGEMYQAIDRALQARPDVARLLATRLQVQEDQLAGAISLHALVLRELSQRVGGRAAGNLDTVYTGFGDDAAFNAGVKRYAADPAATTTARQTLDLTGALRRPLVLQFNHADPSIPARFEPVYPQLAAAAGATPAPRRLPSAGEGHCGFSSEQVVAALQAVATMR